MNGDFLEERIVFLPLETLRGVLFVLGGNVP